MRYDGDFWTMLEGLVRAARVTIDRPRGTAHPRYPDFIYPLDYGYLEGTRSMDGGGIDLWRGSEPEGRLRGILVTVDGEKGDSEIKLLLGCTDAETEIAYRVQNEGGMHALYIPREP